MPRCSTPVATMLLLLAATAALAPGCASQDAGVTVSQFQQLKWLEGAWRGSGGAYAAFYEEYRSIDDSTIHMRSFSDSTLQAATDSSRFELRQGVVVSSRDGQTQYQAVMVQPDRIQFRRPGATSGGFTYTRNTPDQWTATLHPSAPGGAETVYVMRRLGPPVTAPGPAAEAQDR